jgi:hypothetical protein
MLSIGQNQKTDQKEPPAKDKKDKKSKKEKKHHRHSDFDPAEAHYHHSSSRPPSTICKRTRNKGLC